MILLFIFACTLFLDFYWYLQYNKDETYRYGTGWILRFRIGRGIKKKIITRGDGMQYLTRYTIHTNKLFSIKLHKIYASDDACLHDHPWSFFSIILKNGYVEQSFKDGSCTDKVARRFSAPTILFRKANWAHRLVIKEPATTLVVTFKKVRAWGFFTPSGWIFWRHYRQDNINQCD